LPQVLQDGRIRLIRRIGRGSMGTVYEAVQDGSKIALKSLNRCSAEQIYRFKQEFRLLADVSHPHVIKVRELFFENERWFFTMELVDGWPIDRYVHALPSGSVGYAHESEVRSAANDSAPPAEHRPREFFDHVRRLLRQLVEGVAAVHSVRLIHRDLKPSNVVVENNGRVVILDFGLVTAPALGGIGQTVEGTIVGTPGYLAPEVAMRGAVTEAADWYAVGVMLYELLTQRLPWRAAPGELLAMLTTRDPTPAAQVCPDIPRDLNELCCALLSRDPARRPTTEQLLAICRVYPPFQPPKHFTERPTPAPARYFVGREAIMQELVSAYKKSARTAQLVFVDGPAGSGKSTLLAHLSEQLQHVGTPIVLTGRCDERERVPYMGLDSIIDKLMRMLLRMSTEQVALLLPRRISCLTRIFPTLLRVELLRKAADSEQTPEDPREQRRLAAQALRDMLARIAEQRPLVLLLDDLHWADPEGLSFLAEVLSPPDAPCMLVVATRHAERTQAASALTLMPSVMRTVETRMLTLPDLSQTEALELASKLIAADRRSAEHVACESAGVPFFLMMLVDAYRCERTSAGLSLDRVLAQRIAELPIEQRTALELVAVAGRPLPHAILERALIGEAPSFVDSHHAKLLETVRCGAYTPFTATTVHTAQAIDALRRQKLITSFDTHGAVVVYHPSIARAVSTRLDGSRIQHHHQVLISALLHSNNPDTETLAQLFEALGDAAHASALAETEPAARAEAFKRAAELYQRTLELHGPQAAPHSLFIKAAQANSCCGRAPAAARMYLDLAKRAEPSQMAKFAAHAAFSWTRTSPACGGPSLLKQAFLQAGACWPQYVRGTLLSLARRSRGAYFVASTPPTALGPGSPEHLLTTLASEAIYCAMLNGSRAAHRILRLRSDIRSTAARARDDGATRGTVELADCLTAYWEGRWEHVAAQALAAEHHFASAGHENRWECDSARSVRHTIQRHAGLFSDVDSELKAGLVQAQAHTDRYAQLDLSRTALCLRLVRADLAGLDDAHAEVLRLREQYPSITLDYLLMSLDVSIALYRGDARNAREKLTRHWHACRKSGAHKSPLCRVIACGIRLDCTLLEENRDIQARATELRALAKRIEREPIAWASALSSSARACACAITGDKTGALREITWSSEQFHTHTMRATSAGVMFRVGMLLGGPEGEELCAGAKAALSDMTVIDPMCWTRTVHSMY